jgi:hypothetical protein
LLSYLLLFAGSTSVSAAFLKRFVYRNRLVFDLNGWQRVVAFFAGILMLLACIYLYEYGFMLIDAAENTQLLEP